ncbi:MAG: hypothetical protein JO317_04810 [Verrucomicrobiae bacterium]|nr:hypothetical protein [Verrucomicrobiae bacterium]
MRHRTINNHATFGMLLNRSRLEANSPAGYADRGVTVETAKRRQALRHGIPAVYWRLRHHHGFVLSRPI